MFDMLFWLFYLHVSTSVFNTSRNLIDITCIAILAYLSVKN